jgi:glycogen debranching enzyme
MALRLLLVCLLFVPPAHARRQEPAAGLIPKFALPESGAELARRTQFGAFMAVLGRRSAALGYEHRALEAWAYPLQIFDNFELSFRLEGYPLELKGAETMSLVSVRPEATTITYTHAAFTVRQHIFAPLDEPGLIMLLDVDSTLPLAVAVSFRPRLKLMWPAGLMTGSLNWDEDERAYFITEETGRFVGVVGSPAAGTVTETPYQEEPREVPARFAIAARPEQLRGSLIPIVIAGGVRGREEAKATYRRLLTGARELYAKNVEHYRRLLEETTSVSTPDERVNEAFRWAKIGIDKGLADNPLLGRGFVAGFRTAGESERPGFAWFFGRDALWTSFAVNSYGDFEATRAALDFLRKYQRADGKIPHEISQSAALIPWFTDYSYPWASADATPLYIVAHADHLRASGDAEYARAAWDSIMRAYRFTAATDEDGDALVENTKAGHGWVEGGALYPPHEEIYLQGVWMAALDGLAEMAEALGERTIVAEARAAAERTREAVEKTYWLPSRGFYAFATNTPRTAARKAEPGPNRDVRQARMNEQDSLPLFEEQTVMPSVALFWHPALEDERAQSELDHLGSAALATDWGTRIISDQSRLYDPLSYHHGSVWPLFTGWASVAAYRYGRPHVGLQALMANVLLKRQNALGYVTELLSGEFNMPFGRSSHHQVWSEAMIVTPLLRGLLGLEASEGGRVLSFVPQLPADWPFVEVRNVRVGHSLVDLSLTRGDGRTIVRLARRIVAPSGDAATRDAPPRLTVKVAPAFPLDARIRAVRVDGRAVSFVATPRGDVQIVETEVEVAARNEIVYEYEEGTDIYVAREAPQPGDRSTGLRVLRSRAEGDGLRLLLEGSGGRSYVVGLRTRRAIGDAPGVNELRRPGADTRLGFVFNAPGGYFRREFFIPFAETVNAPEP